MKSTSHFSITNFLNTLAYFEDMTTQELNTLSRHCLRYTYAPNELIFLEDDIARGMWILESGSVKIYKLNAEGEEHILHLLGEKDTFNDIAAFDRGKNPANASALSKVKVWLVTTEALEKAILDNSELGLKIIRVLANRVRMLVHRIEDLTLYSVIARLARFLLEQSDNPSLSGPGITRMAIAAHLATTPPTISHALRKLGEMGAIEFNRHQIIITNEDLLKSIAMI